MMRIENGPLRLESIDIVQVLLIFTKPCLILSLRRRCVFYVSLIILASVLVAFLLLVHQLFVFEYAQFSGWTLLLVCCRKR